MTVFTKDNLTEAVRLMDDGHPVAITKICRDTVLQGRDLTMKSEDFEAYLNFAIAVMSINMKVGNSKTSSKMNFLAICEMKEDVKASEMPEKSREIYFQSLPILQGLLSPLETEFAQRMLSGLKAALESNFGFYTGKFTNPMAKGDVSLIGMSDEKRETLKSVGLSSRTFSDKKMVWAGSAAYINYANFLMTTINGKSILERLAVGGEEDFFAYILTEILGDTDVENKCRDVLAQEGIGDAISKGLPTIFFPTSDGQYDSLSVLLSVTTLGKLSEASDFYLKERWKSYEKTGKDGKGKTQKQVRPYSVFPVLTIKQGGSQPQNSGTLGSELSGRHVHLDGRIPARVVERTPSKSLLNGKPPLDIPYGKREFFSKLKKDIEASASTSLHRLAVESIISRYSVALSMASQNFVEFLDTIDDKTDLSRASRQTQALIMAFRLNDIDAWSSHILAETARILGPAVYNMKKDFMMSIASHAREYVL